MDQIRTVQPIILAAGKGTRMGNPELPKVLTPLNGRPLISYLLRNVEEAAFLPAALVVGYKQELVKQALGNGYKYIEQQEQLGTGHAVAVCEKELKDTADFFLVTGGDQPLWTTETLQRLVRVHRNSGAAFSLTTLESDHSAFQNFGRILRDSRGEVQGIREQRDCSPEELLIKEVNLGLYCFSNEWLWPALAKIKPLNTQGEYYITDLLEIAVQEGTPTSSVLIEDWWEALGVNTPEQLQEVQKVIKEAGTRRSQLDD